MLAHAETHGSRDMPEPETVGGNRVRLLRNMEEVIPDMVERINSAHTQIDYTMFAQDNKGEGKQVIDALLAARKRDPNMRITVQFDQVGTFIFPGLPGSKLVKTLRDAGIDVVINKRFGNHGVGVKSGFLRPVDHRKILAIDGESFYVGGMNIAGKFNFWNDTMVRVDGPAASILGASLIGRYTEEGHPVSAAQRALVLASARGPMQGLAGVELLINVPGSRLHATDELVDAIRNTKEGGRVWIMTPNISNPDVADEISAAARRGVDARIAVTKGDGIALPMDYLTMSYYRPMLDAGVVFMRQEGMEHSKVQLVDNMARVGSMNLTRRAMTWDHEISVASDDAQFVKQVEGLFAKTFDAGKMVTMDDALTIPARIANFLRIHAGLKY